MKKDLIISLAVSGREPYPELVKGLEASIEKHWKGDSWIIKEFIPTVTHHKEVPYLFKFELIQEAINRGFKNVFWLDSTMRLNKNIVELLHEKPVVAFDNLGHSLYQYITDEAVSNLIFHKHISIEDEIYTIPMCWGGAFGFDFTKQISHEVFNYTYVQGLTGAFSDGNSNREGFIASRHDQSVLSVILANYGIELLPYGTIASKQDATEETYIIYG